MSSDNNPAKAGIHDSVYDGLLGQSEGHWAFGAMSDLEDDPLAGIDTTVAEGTDRRALAQYCLMLGDDALIMSQQLGAWTAMAPDLEEDVALSNIGLDLLGQARMLLARAAAADPGCVPLLPEGSPVPPEDALAFFRDVDEFYNVRLVETDNGDFASTMARLLLFTVWRLALFQRLCASGDRVLAAVAAKGVKEMTYHRDYAARWVLTLGQGTAESRRRMIDGIGAHWPFVDEMFVSDPVAASLAEVGVEPAQLRDEFDLVIADVLRSSDIARPDIARPDIARPDIAQSEGPGGRAGIHTDSFGPLLSVMQSVARDHPMGRW